MKHGTLLSAATALLLGTTALPALAQTPEQWCTDGHFTANFFPTSFGVHGTNGGPSCAVNYQTFYSTDPWNQTYGGPETYFNIPGGPGIQEFDVRVHYYYLWPAFANTNWIVKVDGQPCPSCTAEQLPGATYVQADNNFYNEVRLKVRYAVPSPTTLPSGVMEFSLEPGFGTPPNVISLVGQEIRFKAVPIGVNFTAIQGYYNAPALPLYILRDPPGDASYSSITSVNDVCSGTTSSMTTGNAQNGYFKARIGVAGTVPFVGLDYEIYGEVGVDVSASQTETSSNEYQTCLSTTSSYNTPMSGAPDDVFIGSAVRYAYGQAIITSRPTCGTVSVTNEFASAPVGTLSSYNFTESTIREDVIPDLIADIAGMVPGAERDRAETQLSVWYQTLAMNDAIKADAPFDVVRDFAGGGNGQTYNLTSSTTESYSIAYDSQLEEGLTYEFGVNIGGSGITAGGDAHFQQGYGRGETGSNVATNSVEYHLEDDDASDLFSVNVFRDEVFGTYVFRLDSAESRTSCSYEGGYQLDQPSLSVGSLGNNHMVLNEVTVGTGAAFPIYVCNNSNVDATYYLKFRTNSNTEGGVLNAFGNQMNSNDNGLELDIPAGECLDVTNLVLTQPGTPIGPDYNIEVYLYSLCEPGISSSVTIEAHYGTGNFGSYCEPSSASGPALGDYIDGVQLGSIDNTGTGGPAGAAYTDYSSTLSTPLSRNSQNVLTVTAGANLFDYFDAWIDYDRNGAFDPTEALGMLVNTSPGQALNFSFTVPADAELGSTIMRVRGVRLGNGEPVPVDPCYSYQAGETEDYVVVINANTPQDCEGVDNGTALPGTACDDGNASTGSDTWTANCECVGIANDCLGVPGGTTVPGTICNDGNADTGGDMYNANCECIGLPYDCEGVIGGTATIGSPCNDADATTGNDVYDANCQCEGQLYDCLGIAGGTTLPGSDCDDANASTQDDVYNEFCQCAGTLVNDCEGALGGPAQPGTACDDGDLLTGNDVYSTNCDCAGLPYDCAGVAGGTATEGTPCDDGNPLSVNDVYNANCGCVGTLEEDCAGIPGGTSQPGSPCDDDNTDTGNDAYNAFCECVGQLIDCEGDAGGTALPGSPCDDGNAETENDAYTLGCECVGNIGTGIAAGDPSVIAFSVQPNPSTGVFSFNNPAQVATRVEVRDAIGRMVMQPMLVGTSRASAIDLSGLASGTYHLVAEAEGHRQVIKIMVQH